MDQIEEAGRYLMARELYSQYRGRACDAEIVEHPDGKGQRLKTCTYSKSTDVGHTWDKKYWSVVRKRGSPPPCPETIKGIQWCGIYATWAWNQTGVDVEWEMFAGEKGEGNGPYLRGSNDRVMTSTDLRFIAPGDILVHTKPHNHHMLVLMTNWKVSPTECFVLQGTSGNFDSETKTIVSRAQHLMKEKDEYFFYSMDSLASNPRNYGHNVPGHR